MLTCFLVIFSDLPLVPSLFFLSILFQYSRRHSLIVPALYGRACFRPDGQLEIQNACVVVRRAILILDRFAILLIFQDGTRRLLWRDSINEACYRHLLVVLKKEH
jgi:hypothetical protein